MTNVEIMERLLKYCRENKLAVAEVTVGDISISVNDVGLAMELTSDDADPTPKPKNFKEAFRRK